MQKCSSLIVLLLSILLIISSCGDETVTGGQNSADPVLYEAGDISIVELHGSYREMGRQYGSLLKDELQEFYSLAIEEYYVGEIGLPLEFLKEGTQEDFALYPERFKNIIYGMAETSGMELDELIILDEIIVIGAIAEAYEACSGVAAWGDYTDNNSLVFGRNFDYPECFKNFSKYMTVAVYNPDDGSIPTASIGYTGQIQTLNGINKEGMFLELNAGSLSDTSLPESPRVPTCILLLSFLFDNSNMAQFDAAFNTNQTMLGLIVNVADKDRACSYEWATFGSMRRDGENEGFLVATNHFGSRSRGHLF